MKVRNEGRRETSTSAKIDGEQDKEKKRRRKPQREKYRCGQVNERYKV